MTLLRLGWMCVYMSALSLSLLPVTLVCLDPIWCVQLRRYCSRHRGEILLRVEALVDSVIRFFCL